MGHVAVQNMVFVISHYLYIYFYGITDETCCYKVLGVCYCTLFMLIFKA